MKKVLLATSILAMSTGFAAAEVALSGSARMGIIDNYADDSLGFTMRIRVNFDMSGETDGGLAFGASVRADNSDEANDSGDAGSVFISGAFGKLSMGDVDGAAQMAVGQVSGVGLTGLSDLNEGFYLGAGDGATDPTALYEYSAGSFTGYLSATNPDNAAGPDADPVLALGLKYAMGDYTVALGYEDAPAIDASHIVLGASATFGAITVKANYGMADIGAVEADQWHVSADYTTGALTVTGFYGDDEEFIAAGLGGVQGYGLGASYDLGGGAKVVGGYAKNDTADTDAFDIGVSFSF